jgi:hypothetical protein
MPSIVSIKFNDEESEILQRAHAASGTSGLSSHIKQVYFDALKLNGDVLREIRDDLSRIGSGVERIRQGGPPSRDDDLLLSVMCGLYVMVRKSVGESIRSQADQVIDVTALESYLAGQ